MERWNVNSEGVHELSSHVEYISVPMGAENGEVILLSNRGNETGDGTRGEVKVTFMIEEHQLFKRNGLDIVVEKNITLKESLCGFSFELKHLNGQNMTFENKTKHNVVTPEYKMVLPNLGMHREGHGKGKLIIEFTVNFPNSLSSEQIESLSKIL